MLVVPGEMPVINPVALIVATPVELTDQVPPGVASVRAVEEPAHTVDAPTIGAAAFTVT